MREKKKIDLGKDRVGVLVAKLAFPAVLAQVINLLYNLVDRMYVGALPEPESTLAIAGLGVVFPITIIALALSMTAGAFACTTLPHHRDLRDRRVWIGELPGMTDVPALDFHSPADNTAARQRLHDTPIDGNDPRNRTDVQGIIPVRLAPGEVAILRWSNRHAQGHGLAIDHLSIKAIK